MQISTKAIITGITPAEQRKIEYGKRKCVLWKGELLTIDEANMLYSAYLAEGNTVKSAALQVLIAEQKTIIRAKILGI